MLLSIKPDKLHLYLYRPYHHLRGLGYRLAGKRGQLEGDKLANTAPEALTRGQEMMGLLFPVMIFFLVMLLELGGAGYLLWQFYPTKPWLILPLAVVAALPLSPYFYQVLFDLWRAYRLWQKRP